MMFWLSLFWACKKDPIVVPDVIHDTLNTTSTPKQPHKEILTAWYYTHKGSWPQAQRFFQLAADKSPADPWIYIHWGDAANKVNQTAIATTKWQQAFDLLLASDVDLKRKLKHKIEGNGDFLQ